MIWVLVTWKLIYQGAHMGIGHSSQLMEYGMSENKQYMEEMVNRLKQERDELRVRLHLAKLDASDEWRELETKWEKLESKAKSLGEAAAAESDDIVSAAKLLGEEIREGFSNIARRL